MRRRPAIAAAFAVVVLVVGQLAALRHEAAQRHVTCADHGELIDAPTLAATTTASGERSRWVGVEGSSGQHQDCAIARVLQQSSSPEHSAPTVDVTAVVTTIDVAVSHEVAVTSELYLIAPKTSPPRLS